MSRLPFCLGNTSDAQNLDRLSENRITHIINCTPDLPFYWEGKHQYLRIDVHDLPSQNIRDHFDPAIEFIGSCLFSSKVPRVVFLFSSLENAILSKDNNVLVHCSAGISRSPTLVLAYMMKQHHLPLDEAFEKMRKLRQIVDPNVSFICQLREWEKSLLSAASTTDHHEENSGTNPASRSGTSASTYCGSTSKSKTDNKKPHRESPITVK